MEQITTERLILRQWKLSDSGDLYEYAKSDLVGHNAGWKQHKSEEESKKIIKMFIDANETYAVVLKEENKVIGSIGIHKREANNNLNEREIGYVLNPKYWGNGYIPEAVQALLEYGFNTMNLDLIWCVHFDFNERSKRVIEKCGFNFKYRKEKKLTLLDNKEVIALFYNISKEEYKKDCKY